LAETALRGDFGGDRFTDATWMRAEGIKKQERKKREERTNWMLAQTTDVDLVSDMWSCMPGGLRELVY